MSVYNIQVSELRRSMRYVPLFSIQALLKQNPFRQPLFILGGQTTQAPHKPLRTLLARLWFAPRYPAASQHSRAPAAEAV